MLRTARWLAGVLTWLALVSVAWAGYDARIAEMREQLAKAQLQDTKERQELQNAVDAYAASRSQALDDLVHIVEETSTSRLEQERAWSDRLNNAKSDMAKSIGDSLRSINTPSLAALALRQTMFVDEDKFWTGLQTVRVAEARDQILDNQQKVAEMTRVLDEKWRALLEQDKSLDEGEKSVSEDLKSLVDQVSSEIALERRSPKEKLINLVNVASQVPLPPDWPDYVDAFKQMITEGTNRWLTLNTSYFALQAKYKAYVTAERSGILVLFKDTRKTTQDFVDKNDFKLMKDRYAAARSKLDDWRSGLQPAGQKRDAEDMAKDLLGKLSNHLSGTERIFNEFVSRHQFKFFGLIGPEIAEALVEHNVWEDRIRSIQGKDLESRLRDWRSDADNWWSVDTSPLSSAQRDWLKGQIKEHIDKLIEAEEKFSRMSEKDIRAFFDRLSVENDLKQ